jgi:hypothetical protein
MIRPRGGTPGPPEVGSPTPGVPLHFHTMPWVTVHIAYHLFFEDKRPYHAAIVAGRTFKKMIDPMEKHGQ